MLNGDDVTALCRPGPDPDAGPGCCFNYWWPDATREHGIANLTNPVPIDETDYISDSFTRFLEGLDGRPVLHQPPVLQQQPVFQCYTSTPVESRGGHFLPRICSRGYWRVWWPAALASC